MACYCMIQLFGCGKGLAVFLSFFLKGVLSPPPTPDPYSQFILERAQFDFMVIIVMEEGQLSCVLINPPGAV